MYFVASFYCREETDRRNQNMCRMALQTFRIRKRDIHMEKVCISTSPVSLYAQIGTNGQVHHTVHRRENIRFDDGRIFTFDFDRAEIFHRRKRTSRFLSPSDSTEYGRDCLRG